MEYGDACVLWVLAKADDRSLEVLEGLPAGVRLARGETAEAFDGQPPPDAILVCSIGRDVVRAVLAEAPSARWIHTRSAGVEGLPLPEIAARGLVLTNGRGAFSRSLAEWAMGALLFFAKDFRRLVRSQEAGRWEQFAPQMLAGRWVGIVGYGDIGRAVATLAGAFGMRVRALRRSAGLPGSGPAPDEMLPPGRLAELMALSDDVVVATPLTAETRGLVGEREIGAMKPTSVLVNVGRGAVVREAPLVDALRRRAILGAALDVFETEPLPAGHPFYTLDNVLLSPHCADQVPGWLELAMHGFRDNLLRFLEGRPLENVVDPSRGY